MEKYSGTGRKQDILTMVKWQVTIGSIVIEHRTVEIAKKEHNYRDVEIAFDKLEKTLEEDRKKL